MERRATTGGFSGRLCLLGLTALVALYLLTVLPRLGHNPIAGGDEGWIMSASAKLAEEGTFGSDLFRGFYGVEERYYFNLPLHHLVLAGAFEVIGAGLAEARLVSVGYGLAALLLTYALGRRLGGPVAGLAAAALLVLLRLNLAPFSGLTLTDLGATVRYDLITTPYALGAALVLLRRPDSPSLRSVAVAGLLIGLAALTQFIGAFYAAPAGLFLLTLSLPAARRLLLAAVFSAGVALPFLPYAAYIAPHFDNFRGQARSVEQETAFLSPSFYWRQLKGEPDRYRLSVGIEKLRKAGDAVSRPSARLTMLLVAPLATASVLWRGRTDPRDRLLGFVVVGLVLQLALFESTKRFVYWVVVVPFLCVAIAELGRAALAWRPGGLRRWLAAGATAAVLGLFALEGAAVAAKHARDVRHAPDYDALGVRLKDALPLGASAIGDNRLWPLLRERDYRSLLLLFYHTNPRISKDRATDISGALQRIDPDYVLLSPLSREILSRLSMRDAADFAQFLSSRAERIATVEDQAYGPIEVYRVRK